MSVMLIISVPLIVYGLYKHGREVYNSIVARDYSRLKGALLFFFLIITLSIGQLLFIHKFL